MRLFRNPAAMLLLLAAAAIAFMGCSGGGPGQMTAEPVPAGWEQDLLSFRASKDMNYATAPDTPLHPDDRAAFAGLSYFPPDPAYRLVGELHLHEAREQFTILSTTGKARPAERYGEFRFSLEGENLVLQVYRLLDSKAPTPVQELFLPFTDRTSGVESYPAGRYVLDFNRAFNPLCAYGMPERYACPVTPAENRLKVRVESGEQGYRRG